MQFKKKKDEVSVKQSLKALDNGDQMTNTDSTLMSRTGISAVRKET